MRRRSSTGSHGLHWGRGCPALSIPPPTTDPGPGSASGWERVPQGTGGSSSMQLPLGMESSAEEESWLEDQWEKW